MKSQIITMGVQEASRLLSRNNSNRPLSRSRVERYKKDLVLGNWKLTHQPIAVDEFGDLLDGQHRLTAVVEAGIAMQVMVVVGAPRDTFCVVDTGGTRTASDIMAINELEPRTAKMVSAAIPYCISYESGGVPQKAITTRVLGNSNVAVLNYFSQNKNIACSADFIRKMPHRSSVLRDSIACFLHYQISRKHDDADSFMAMLLDGAGITRGSMLHILREQLLSSRLGNYRLIDSVIINRIIRTYNGFRAKENLKDPRQALSAIMSDSKPLRIL